MIPVDHKENETCDSHYLMKRINKNLEFKVIKNILNTNYDVLQQRKATFKEECKKLDDVNYSVWAIEDKFCNEIWKFSFEHNFNAFFEHYPNVPEVIESHVTENYVENNDTNKRSVFTELENEIDAINNEIALLRNNNIEQDIKSATFVLNNLKSFSEEVLDLIRVIIKTSENSQNVCNVSTHQQLNNANVTKGFESARKILMKSNVPFRKKVTTNSREIIEKPKKGCNTRCNNVEQNDAKFGKFVLKKPSVIAFNIKHKLKTLD